MGGKSKWKKIHLEYAQNVLIRLWTGKGTYVPAAGRSLFVTALYAINPFGIKEVFTAKNVGRNCEYHMSLSNSTNSIKSSRKKLYE